MHEWAERTVAIAGPKRASLVVLMSAFAVAFKGKADIAVCTFFTTKPAGEGTGLGLSISHDIVVKQHGGAIDVDTQPGVFTEITVILPRAAVFLT